MTTENKYVHDSTVDATKRSNLGTATLGKEAKRIVTPAERWLLICENVYARAQQRGFVGGNPLQDLADAEQEIDTAYETDFNCVFSLTTTAEITEQLKSLFAGFGIDREDLESLLDGHQLGLERLAAMNRDLLDSTSAAMARQTQLLEGVASEAVRTLQSVAQGRLGPEGVFNIAELSMQAFDDALASLQVFENSSTPSLPADRPTETTSRALLEGVIASDFKGCSASQLVAAPVTALKGVSSSLAERLGEVFGIHTIGELAANQHAVWARAIVLLAESSVSSSEQADESMDLPAVAHLPINEVRDCGESQARLLQEEFGIETVNDLGTHPLFDIARAIALLAESEN